MAEVRKIEATVPLQKRRKRVAAYARVSMETESLHHSLQAQVDHYSRLIRANPEWEYAGVFADDGITGTSTERREEFNRLMAKCEAGRIDAVLVKSVSRFARNTVDTLKAVRRLKEIGVEVRFEREGISSMSGEGELLLTILASYAQEESRSISDNVKWSVRRKFREGVPNTHKAPFGYRWDGKKYRAVPEQAEAVKEIFRLYLEGLTPFEIRDRLREEGVRTQTGKEMTDGTVRSILSNISYTGPMILQKNYITDSHRRAVNRGELERYRVDGMYEPLITEEDFEKAQAVRERRAQRPSTSISPLHGRVRCGCCGYAMSRRTAAGKKKWACNRKERNKACSSKGIYEDELLTLTEGSSGPVTVFDDRVEVLLAGGRKVSHPRSYKGKRRGGFSGRLFCGLCGSPLHREKLKGGKMYRRCSLERKHGCPLPPLPEEELLEACRGILGGEAPEATFARDAERLTAYEDRLEFTMKGGLKRQWRRR